MARVTVTDCLEHVDNHFQLVLIATKRSRQLILGAEPLVAVDNDKPTVLALREIAADLIGPSILDKVIDIPELSFDNGDSSDQSSDSDDSTDALLTRLLSASFAMAASDDDGEDANADQDDSDSIEGEPSFEPTIAEPSLETDPA